MLPNGREFGNFVEFKTELKQQQDRFVRALAEKLLIYATGRVLDPSDRATINHIVTAAQSSPPTLKLLIREVVASDAFLSK